MASVRMTGRIQAGDMTRAPWWVAPVVLVAMLTQGTLAGTINVPADHSSIQEAIDASTNGDTVLVAPGRYNETLDLKGKAITLKSSSGAEDTILDGARLNNSVIHCVSGEGKDTLIDGFTVTGGTGDPSFHGPEATIGGGAVVIGSSPRFRNCTFRGNIATYNGGGMYNGNGSRVTLEKCRFESNNAQKGGGVFNLESSPEFISTDFEGNGARYAGGAIYNANQSAALIRHCNFTLNLATYNGGAIYNYDSTPTISDCLFFNNAATYKGGAIYHGYRSGTLVEDGTSRFQTDNDDIAGGGYLLGLAHPHGACCLGGACIEVEEEPCIEAGGVWAGANSTCEEVLAAFCPKPMAGDMNKDGEVDVDDMAILMNIWGRRAPDGTVKPR